MTTEAERDALHERVEALESQLRAADAYFPEAALGRVDAEEKLQEAGKRVAELRKALEYIVRFYGGTRHDTDKLSAPNHDCPICKAEAARKRKPTSSKRRCSGKGPAVLKVRRRDT